MVGLAHPGGVAAGDASLTVSSAPVGMGPLAAVRSALVARARVRARARARLRVRARARVRVRVRVWVS